VGFGAKHDVLNRDVEEFKREWVRVLFFLFCIPLPNSSSNRLTLPLELLFNRLFSLETSGVLIVLCCCLMMDLVLLGFMYAMGCGWQDSQCMSLTSS
jgi:hypothetical protein